MKLSNYSSTVDTDGAIAKSARQRYRSRAAKPLSLSNNATGPKASGVATIAIAFVLVACITKPTAQAAATNPS